jgi:hypothetical protein
VRRGLERAGAVYTLLLIVVEIIYICVWMWSLYQISHWAPEKSGTTLIPLVRLYDARIGKAGR